MTNDKYKNALAHARQAYGSGAYDDATLEAIFPELRESEDERIRKELIEFIQWAEDRGMTRHDYHQAKRPAEWIAYLEKQKESLHIQETCKEKTDSFTDKDERIRKRLIEYFEGFRMGNVEVRWEGLIVQEVLAWLEKQKEPHYTKRNALFDKCVENCDPKVMKEVSDKVDEMLGKPSCWDSPVMTHEMIMEEQKEQKDYRKLYEDIAKSEWFKKAYVGKSLGEEDEKKEQEPAWNEEDEGIRKTLIHIVKGACNKYGIKYRGDEITEEMLLAYLEKRKEQKPISFSEPYVPDDYEVVMGENTTSLKRKEQKPESLIYDKDLDKAAREFYLSGGADSPVDSTGLVPIVRMAEFGATWMKERMEKEQKPVEHSYSNDNSEYDKGYMDGKAFQLKQTEQYSIGKTFMGLIPCWVNAPSTLQPAHKYHGKNAVIMHENNGGFRCCFIDDDKPVTIHLPENTLFVEGWRKRPAEWSEEDEEEINIISEIIEHCTTIPYSGGTLTLSKEHKKKLQYFIKSLRPQPKQEWSEEDKAMVGCIACCLDGSFVTEAARKQCLEWFNKHRRDFLNSPSWKPTEEQMDSLRDTIIHTKGYSYSMYLPEIYEQLKKL